jgi:hypothetical protein
MLRLDACLHFPCSWCLLVELAVPLHLADVVHQALEQPLRVDLALAAQAQALELAKDTGNRGRAPC